MLLEMREGMWMKFPMAGRGRGGGGLEGLGKGDLGWNRQPVGENTKNSNGFVNNGQQ